MQGFRQGPDDGLVFREGRSELEVLRDGAPGDRQAVPMQEFGVEE
jgi:hypothetical protein